MTQPPSEENILQYSPPRKRISGLAVTSLILGIAAVPLVAFWFLGMIPGLIAIILGFVSILQIRRYDHLTGKPLAITGIILGAIALMLGTACGYLLFHNI